MEVFIHSAFTGEEKQHAAVEAGQTLHMHKTLQRNGKKAKSTTKVI